MKYSAFVFVLLVVSLAISSVSSQHTSETPQTQAPDTVYVHDTVYIYINTVYNLAPHNKWYTGSSVIYNFETKKFDTGATLLYAPAKGPMYSIYGNPFAKTLQFGLYINIRSKLSPVSY